MTMLAMLQAGAPASSFDLLKTAGIVLGVIIAAPLSVACLRAAAFFGSMKTTVEGLEEAVKLFTAFATDHGTRLAVVENEIDNLKGVPVHIHKRVTDS